MTAQPFKRISPAEVTRDEDGYWLHPDFPHFEEEISNSEWQEYLEQNQLQSRFVYLDGDAPEGVADRYFESGDADCSVWSPTKPDGDGWFLFGIWDTEDGPTSCWVRHNEEAGELASQLLNSVIVQSSIVPESWQLVPVYPTSEMLDATNEHIWGRETDQNDMLFAYQAMLAAAPKQEGSAAVSHEQFDLVAHLKRQMTFSQKAFGPNPRTSGVLDHIRKELCEVEKSPDDISEWIDIVLLALDGAWRRGFSPEEICKALAAKQQKNEKRVWPDWREAPEDKAIEHVEGGAA